VAVAESAPQANLFALFVYTNSRPASCILCVYDPGVM